MNGEANYKGVDFSFEKRFTDGLGYRASYTIGEARDQAPEHLNASSGRAQNTRDLESWEGPSDFDVRHRFVANFIAELPFGEASRCCRTVAARFLATGGERHLQRTLGPRLHGDAGKQQRGRRSNGMPNLTGDPKGAETVQQWFNPTAFTQVPSGTFGMPDATSARTGMDHVRHERPAPDRFQQPHEHDLPPGRLQLFNRANFGLPAANIAANNAGVISSLAGDPRVMQLSLRFGF
jgi:hypothetical protein